MKTQKSSPSLGLYKEGLLQLRFMGLLSGGLIVAASAVTAISTLLTTRGLGQDALGGVASVIDPSSLISFAELAVWLLPFLFVLRLFSFLNKRNRSDFYHALPVSRTKLYFSFLAAAVTWIWGIGLIVVALTTVSGLIEGAAFTFATVAVALGLFLTASLFAAGATLVSVAVTGTRFSNLVVTALIVLLPHLIASFFVQGVIAMAPNLPTGYIGLIGGVSVQNTFFMLSPAAFLFGSVAGGPVSSGASIAVTFLWSVVLVVLGVWLFVRRPAEAAGKSAPGRRLQLIYRVAIGALVVALGMSAVLGSASGYDPIMMIGIGGFGDYGPTTSLSAAFQIGSIVTLLVVTLIVFLLFELITTRKWGRLLRALPSFGLVIVFALAFYGAILLYGSYEKGFKPSADQIASVRLLDTQYDGTGQVMTGPVFGGAYGDTVQPPSYNQLLLQRATIKDPAFIRATANKLKEYFPSDAAYGGDENHSVMLVEVRAKSGRTAYRLVYVRTAVKPDAFNQAIFATQEVANALLALPPLDKHADISAYAYMSSYDASSSNASPITKAQQSRQTRALFTAFKSEYERLSPEEQYQCLYGAQYGNLPVQSSETTTLADFTGGGGLDFSGVSGGKTFTNSYALITPQASKRCWEMTRSELEKILDARGPRYHLDEFDLYDPKAARSAFGTTDTYADSPADPLWSVMTKRYASDSYGDASDFVDDADVTPTIVSDTVMNKAAGIIHAALSRDFATDAPYYVSVTYGLYDKHNNETSGNSLVIALNAQEAAALRALTGNKEAGVLLLPCVAG